MSRRWGILPPIPDRRCRTNEWSTRRPLSKYGDDQPDIRDWKWDATRVTLSAVTLAAETDEPGAGSTLVVRSRRPFTRSRPEPWPAGCDAHGRKTDVTVATVLCRCAGRWGSCRCRRCSWRPCSASWSPRMSFRLRWQRKYFTGMSSTDKDRCCYCPSTVNWSVITHRRITMKTRMVLMTLCLGAGL